MKPSSQASIPAPDSGGASGTDPAAAAGAPVDAPEVVVVDSHRVWCDGPEGEGMAALGHPRVYLEMGAAGFVECGYCDRRFVLSAHAHDESERLDPGVYEGSSGQ